MIKLTRLDVLIVYSEKIANSACKTAAIAPFVGKNISYNVVYGYFLNFCRQSKLKAAFTTSADIIGPGLCRSYWTYHHHSWHKVISPCFSNLIFDKFSPTSHGVKSRRQLLFSDPDIKSFNDPVLFDLFFDKQLTYNKLSQHAIPTISLSTHSLTSIKAACRSLASITPKSSANSDFTSDIIMKDRFGAGGRHVYKFEKGDSQGMMTTSKKHAHISFIIQPFARFDQGFSFQQSFAATDIRFVFLQGKIIQSYIRVAKSGEFRCNEHQGGTLTYLPLSDIPSSLIAKSTLIAKTLNHDQSLYALDFIISNNGNPYLLEGNTSPGLDWNFALKQNETKAKQLIRLVVGQLASRAILFRGSKPNLSLLYS